MTAEERLAKVKTVLYGSASGNFNDDQLTILIESVIEDLVDGGVDRTVAESKAAIGCIAVGVNDLWNYSSGGVKYSEYFNRRLIQLAAKGAVADV